MILIDTSAWIEFFRGRQPLSSRVDAAIADNDAAYCGPIDAEIRRGLIHERDRRQVLTLLQGCHFLSQPDGLWLEAGDIGFALRKSGVTCKTMDLLIAAYALAHSVPLLTKDKDFAAMQKAGVAIVLL